MVPIGKYVCIFPQNFTIQYLTSQYIEVYDIFVDLFCYRFWAPEIAQSDGTDIYTNKIDMWSGGVILFIMLSGTLPFADEYGTPLNDQISKAAFSFRSKIWKNVTETAKGLISDLIIIDAEKRLSANEALNHAWLNDTDMMRLAHTIMGVDVTGN